MEQVSNHGEIVKELKNKIAEQEELLEKRKELIDDFRKLSNELGQKCSDYREEIKDLEEELEETRNKLHDEEWNNSILEDQISKMRNVPEDEDKEQLPFESGDEGPNHPVKEEGEEATVPEHEYRLLSSRADELENLLCGYEQENDRLKEIIVKLNEKLLF